MVDARALAQVIILNEVMDSDDEKPHRRKTKRWLKRRRDRGYFNNIIKELRIEDCTGSRDMLRMEVADFDCILTQISDLISRKHRLGGIDPIKCDERLAVTLLLLAITSCLCLKTDFFVF